MAIVDWAMWRRRTAGLPAGQSVCVEDVDGVTCDGDTAVGDQPEVRPVSQLITKMTKFDAVWQTKAICTSLPRGSRDATRSFSCETVAIRPSSFVAQQSRQRTHLRAAAACARKPGQRRPSGPCVAARGPRASERFRVQTPFGNGRSCGGRGASFQRARRRLRAADTGSGGRAVARVMAVALAATRADG
jgi:hypothetical protein